MRIIIVGAVAAGTSAAAKARRNREDAEIVMYEKDSDISYSGCGMPYYLGGEVENADALVPRDPAYFKNKYNIDVLIGHEVTAIDAAAHTITVKNLQTGRVFSDFYDRLVLATGARATVPPIAGVMLPHVFTLRNIGDMRRIKAFLDSRKPRSAAIIGTGFIGLEVAENLKGLGIAVTMLEKLTQVTPGLDSDMAAHVRSHLLKNGVAVHTGRYNYTVGDRDIRETGITLRMAPRSAPIWLRYPPGFSPTRPMAGKAAGVTWELLVPGGFGGRYPCQCAYATTCRIFTPRRRCMSISN